MIARDPFIVSLAAHGVGIVAVLAAVAYWLLDRGMRGGK